jgi:xylan 1,4-beta-xylosidase
MSCEGDISLKSTFPLSEGNTGPTPPDARYHLPATGAVWLKCDVDFQALAFSWSVDGATWNKLPVTLNYALISDEAGKGEGGSFTGAFVGMACQDLSGQDCPADFDYFEYREKADPL